MKKKIFLGIVLAVCSTLTGCVCYPLNYAGICPTNYGNGGYDPYAYSPNGGGACAGGGCATEVISDCGGCGECSDCGVVSDCAPCAVGPCASHRIVGCNTCFPVAKAVGCGVVQTVATPVSWLHSLFNYGYYPSGGCGPRYWGECNRACSTCDSYGNYTGGPCGVGCAQNPAVNNQVVNYLGGPCGSSTLSAANSPVFSDKLAPNFAETQLQSQFQTAGGCAPCGIQPRAGMMQIEDETVVYDVVSRSNRAVPDNRSNSQMQIAAAQKRNAQKSMNAQVLPAPQRLVSGTPRTMTASTVQQQPRNVQVKAVAGKPLYTNQATVARKPSPNAIATVSATELPPQKQIITANGAKLVPRN